MNKAISGVDLPNPMTRSNVGLITDSQASSPGVIESIGLVAKQEKGSFSLPRGTEAGRLAARLRSLEIKAEGAGASIISRSGCWSGDY